MADEIPAFLWVSSAAQKIKLLIKLYKMNICINNFYGNCINFLAKKPMSLDVLWTSKYFENKNFSDIIFINADSKCFVGIEFTSDLTFLTAERYGGVGTGANGGGVRCGNIGDVQLKGIGINPMLGINGDYSHSTGYYSVSEALKEVINTNVYEKILPISPIKIFGLATIGVAEYKLDRYKHKVPLAVVAREKCIRPAHFLPQPHFLPQKKFEQYISKDVSRVRISNNLLKSNFSSESEFISYLGKFLSVNANQLAFMKIFRISHGAYSPSNISFDGRFLDMTNITMFPTGVNYSAGSDSPAFLQEVFAPISIIRQVAYNYGKFNYKDLNVAPLVEYYQEQLNEYSLHYLLNLFGLLTNDNQISYTEKKTLYKYIINTINGDGEVKYGAPQSSYKKDLLIPILKALFFHASTKKSLDTIIKIPSDILNAFNGLIDTSYKLIFKPIGYDAFLMSAAIRAFRKAYFADFFYRGRIESHIEYFVSSAELDKYAGYINSYTHVASWIFDKDDNESDVVIFKSEKIVIYFDSLKNRFTIKSDLVKDYSDLEINHYLKSTIDSEFLIAGYNFKEGIIKILDFLSGFNSID